MNDTKAQVLTFLEKCEELKNCKFIMATTKIKDILKCIVNNSELYSLFDTVTKNFDYIEAKTKCLVTVDDGLYGKSCVVLPQRVGERLAFIFCLLVEFDRDTLNFNDFLQRYFPEDDSYFASYRAFCRSIVDSLEGMIKQVFREQFEDEGEVFEPAPRADSLRAKLISEIYLNISSEKQYILQSPIPKEEKEGGCKMLNALNNAVKEGNEDLIDALICGYNYFVLYHKAVSDGIAPLIESLAEYEKTL